MMDTGKKYYIVDTRGDYYKLNNNNNLVMAKDSSDATTFTIQEANARIGTGRKSHFYSILEAFDVVSPVIEVVPEETYSDSEYDTVKKPTMFDSLQNNWEEMLSNLCYMSSHMDEYQCNLKQMLSDVDKEICDLMHYLEFNDLDDCDMLKASKMLQERRRHRRKVKDEMEKTVLMRETFLDRAFETKIHQSLEVMEKMKERQYTPRKLNDLFQQQRATA